MLCPWSSGVLSQHYAVLKDRQFPVTFINDGPATSVLLFWGAELTTPQACVIMHYTCESHAFLPDICLPFDIWVWKSMKAVKGQIVIMNSVGCSAVHFCSDVLVAFNGPM